MKKITLLMVSILLAGIFLVSCADGDSVISIEKDSITIDLYPADADLTDAPNLIVEQTEGIDNLGGWQEYDMPSWNITLEEATAFELEMEYSRYNAPNTWGIVLIEGTNGYEIMIEVRFTATSTTDDDWSVYEKIENRIANMLPAGDYKVTLIPNYDKSDEPQPSNFINLRSMSFVLNPDAELSDEVLNYNSNNESSNEDDYQQDRKDWEERFGYYVADITAENIENYTGTWYLYGDSSNLYYIFKDNKFEGFDPDGNHQTGIWGVTTTTNHTPIEPVEEELIEFYPSDGVDSRLTVLPIDNIVLHNSMLKTYYVRSEAIGTPEADLLIERLSLISPAGSWIGDDFTFDFEYYDNVFNVYPQSTELENLSLSGMWNIDGDILTLEFDDGTVETTKIIENEFMVDYYGGLVFSVQ